MQEGSFVPGGGNSDGEAPGSSTFVIRIVRKFLEHAKKILIGGSVMIGGLVLTEGSEFR